jgi:hypothetical protein
VQVVEGGSRFIGAADFSKLLERLSEAVAERPAVRKVMASG